FTFGTESDLLNRTAAQLIIFAPGATNIPPNVVANIPAFVPGQQTDAVVAQGTPGAADPAQPVLLVNETSGETSTVLSKADGSFFGFIRGAEEDLISATLINGNGTRTYLSASRQLFDNGFVGLYRGGGDLKAEKNGKDVQVMIRPGVISD